MQYGEFDAYTYQMIQQISYKDNQVKIIYCHMDECYEKLCKILIRHGIDIYNTEITSSLLYGQHIGDYLNLHTFPTVHGVKSTFADCREPEEPPFLF